jgi:hypothetical protein
LFVPERDTVHVELTKLYLTIVPLAQQVRDSLDQEEDWFVVLVRYRDGLSRLLSDEDVERSRLGFNELGHSAIKKTIW